MAARPARIRALIVDDEPLARSNLRVLLGQDTDIESVRECGSGTEAVSQIRAERPDLVFLDVQMPECGGFEVLKMLEADKPLPVIVFVTAYDEYAVRAFDAGALDYLLKPFDDARFHLAMQRAKEKIVAREPAPPLETPRLTVRSAGQVAYVPVTCVCMWATSRICCARAWPNWNRNSIRKFSAVFIVRPSSICEKCARLKSTRRENTR
jgi:two-component system, LytTR family, response regulator